MKYYLCRIQAPYPAGCRHRALNLRLGKYVCSHKDRRYLRLDRGDL